MLELGREREREREMDTVDNNIFYTHKFTTANESIISKLAEFLYFIL